MNDGIGRVYEPVVAVLVEAKLGKRQIAPEDPYLRLQELVDLLKRQVELQRLPQPHFRFVRVISPHQEVERGVMLFQQVGSDMRANIARRPGKKNCHDDPEANKTLKGLKQLNRLLKRRQKRKR